MTKRWAKLISIINKVELTTRDIFPFYFAFLSAVGLLTTVYLFNLLLTLTGFSYEPYSGIISMGVYLGLFIFSYTLIYDANFYKKAFLISSIILWLALCIGFLLI